MRFDCMKMKESPISFYIPVVNCNVYSFLDRLGGGSSEAAVSLSSISDENPAHSGVMIVIVVVAIGPFLVPPGHRPSRWTKGQTTISGLPSTASVGDGQPSKFSRSGGRTLSCPQSAFPNAWAVAKRQHHQHPSYQHRTIICWLPRRHYHSPSSVAQSFHSILRISCIEGSIQERRRFARCV